MKKLIAMPKGKKSVKVPLTEEEIKARRAEENKGKKEPSFWEGFRGDK